MTHTDAGRHQRAALILVSDLTLRPADRRPDRRTASTAFAEANPVPGHLRVVLRESDEARIRAPVLQTAVASSASPLPGLWSWSQDLDATGRSKVVAGLPAVHRDDRRLGTAAIKTRLEPGVTSLRWGVAVALDEDA